MVQVMTSKAEATAAFEKMVARLSRLSTDKGFDAYRDVDWDSPKVAMTPGDLRFVLPDVDPLGCTEWYQSQPIELQARIGLVRMASCLKTGWHFENLLQQALLHRALELPDDSVEFRYLHHEIIEESQHTLMFHEFVHRSGVQVRGMSKFLRTATIGGIRFASRHQPSLFFVMVLGGEDPIDLLQRRMLATGTTHPLLAQIMRIHIAEEARHISYARSALKREVPRLGRIRRQLFSVAAPVVLGIMVRIMVRPTVDVVRAGVPRSVIRDAFSTSDGRTLLADSASKPRQLLQQLDAVTPLGRLTWKALGIWS